MRIALMTWGTRGDVQPFVAIGKRLAALGHQVTLWCPPAYVPAYQGAPLSFRPWLADAELPVSTLRALSMRLQGGYLASIQGFAALVQKASEELLQSALEAFADADVVVATGIAISAPLVARSLGRSYVSCAFSPVDPTASFQHPLVRLPLPAWARRSSFQAAWKLAHALMRPAFKRWNQSLGLPAASHPWQTAPHRLYAFSRFLVPRPLDWPLTSRIVGCFFDEVPSWQPPKALVDFLASGPPPVCLTVGSVKIRRPGELTRAMVEAVLSNNARAIVLTSPQGLLPVEAAGVLSIDFAPYDWLFPKMGCIVHHGGSGTTHAAIRAGTPSVIVPQVSDGFFWAARAAKYGVSTSPLPIRGLTALRLAHRIEEALEDGGIRERARAMGLQMESERGIDVATEYILRSGQSGGQSPL